MSSKVTGPQYEVIDTDPHFKRVVGYFRPTDYLTWAAGTASLPAAIYAWERIDKSVDISPRSLRSAIKLNASLGFFFGFYLAYQNSTKRFWGRSENAREVAMDKEEMTGKIQRGEPLFGNSSLTPYMQTVAARNSTNSQAFLQAIPWFNFVNHPHHGVDESKYTSTPSTPS